MNIDEYRAMVAQQKEQGQKDSQKGEQPDVQAQPAATPASQPPLQETTPTKPDGGEQKGETEKPQSEITTVDIDGKPVPIDELKKGYLRQSDYTRKTQELARERQKAQIAEDFYEKVKSNPELAQRLATDFDLKHVDPVQSEMMELKQNYYDLLLEKKIGELQSSYDDFDPIEVIKVAQEMNLGYDNLEDAYHIYKSRSGASAPADTLDVEALKEQIRQELKQELQSEVDTTTIIQSGGQNAPTQENAPKVTRKEIDIARNLRMTVEEYVKWRDKK